MRNYLAVSESISSVLFFVAVNRPHSGYYSIPGSLVVKFGVVFVSVPCPIAVVCHGALSATKIPFSILASVGVFAKDFIDVVVRRAGEIQFAIKAVLPITETKPS